MSADDELLSARLERLSVGGRRRTKSRSGRPTRPTVTFKGKCSDKLSVCSCPPAPVSTGITIGPISSGTQSVCISPEVPERLMYHRPSNDLQLASVQRDLNTLVSDCNRLKISDDAVSDQKNAPSCSQQALNPPCDVTIDELASYFETFVHIPKKMTTMAEMMYT